MIVADDSLFLSIKEIDINGRATHAPGDAVGYIVPGRIAVIVYPVPSPESYPELKVTSDMFD